MTTRIIKGESMLPFLRPLDECVCERIEPSQITSGDIVTFKIPQSDELGVHRVLSVDRKERHITVKGDNLPYSSRDIVSFSDVNEKVAAVRRDGVIIDLREFPRRYSASLIAFFSRADLTPLLFKRRFIDPFLLAASKSSLFKSFRKLSYDKLVFSAIVEERRLRLYAFVRRTLSARAIIEEKGPEIIKVTTYIRYRDRNPYFAERFLSKVVEIVDKEYGPGKKIVFDDPELKLLLRQKAYSLYPEKVFFPSYP
ncbi:MAG: S24/S26 family peptidase [Candidatus Omnitrophota bacterium]|nr:S24/S26 family peptidase [Candidatus Omnitrophota bacterium]